MARKIINLVFGLLLAGIGMDACAGSASANKNLVESSLLVSGNIVIAPDGSVKSYALDSTAALGASLEKFLDNNITRWRFKPVEVDGRAVTAKAPMSMRLIANRKDDGGVTVRIANTWFGDGSNMAISDHPQSKKLTPPRYPPEIASLGGQGVVYLIVNIGRDGRVLNVEAEKVNLRSIGTDDQMDMLRRQFSKVAVSAARRWTFTPPKTGEEASKDSWKVRVPVSFMMAGMPQPKAGEWESYIPDPTIRDIPWAREELQAAGSPDALPGNGVYPLRQGMQLLTPPGT